jgi:hypothetical protein
MSERPPIPVAVFAHAQGFALAFASRQALGVLLDHLQGFAEHIDECGSPAPHVYQQFGDEPLSTAEATELGSALKRALGTVLR